MVGPSLDLSSLSVAQQQHTGKATLDTRPKAVKTWTSSLPRANLGETSRQVFKVIIELNRTPLPPQQRLKTLELLSEPVQYVSASLEKYFSGRPLPLKPKNRKISELSRALFNEMATGYKLVAKDLLASKSKPASKEISLALHRAMHYLGLVLLRCYQVYAPCPRNLWKEVHTMYAYAEHYKTGKNRFALPDNNKLECSLSDTYKRILLLSLSTPYQLLRGEIDIISSALCSLVPRMRITTINPGEKPAGLFIIDLATDREPAYVIAYDSDDMTHCRLLDMSELVARLHNREIGSAMPDGLLQRLLTSWSMVPKRSYSRTTNDCHPVEVAFGLSAAHHFVSGQVPFRPDISQDSLRAGGKSEFTSTFVANLGDVQKGPDIWSSNYSYSDNDPLNAPSLTQSLSSEQAPNPVTYSKVLLEMNNTSAGGCCLTASENEISSAQVGDLLAIREQQNIDIDQWGIGVIRRLKNIAPARIELGIQMLTPNAVAVAACLLNENGSKKSSQFLRCLMLPELRAINQPATLIAPNLPFTEGSRILLNINKRLYHAHLTRTLQKTRSFSQFEFTMNAAVARTDTTGMDTGTIANEADFESVWQSL